MECLSTRLPEINFSYVALRRQEIEPIIVGIGDVKTDYQAPYAPLSLSDCIFIINTIGFSHP